MHHQCVQLWDSHHIIFAGLELEVVCLVKYRVLLHEQLLVELLYYLRKEQEQTINAFILTILQSNGMSVTLN